MSTVRKGDAGDRFEIVDDDGVVAGAAHYLESDGGRIFFHTTVDDAHAGQGLARELVAAALDATRADGLRAVPVCPYVERLVARDHQWDDVVVPVTPEALAAVQAHTSR